MINSVVRVDEGIRSGLDAVPRVILVVDAERGVGHAEHTAKCELVKKDLRACP